MVEITCPTEVVGNVYGCFGARRGTIEEEIPMDGVPLIIMKGFLPISESFGFTSFLREKTNGKAFPNCVFDHWEPINGDITDKNSNLYKLIQVIRKRKSLKEDIPNVNDYIDRL